MFKAKAIIVCVNYDDLLRITLPLNARHFTEVLVVSSPTDVKTAAVVADVANARLFQTDAFYRYGAKFNKGLAMEEGFDQLGREGWISVLDADTILPPRLTDIDRISPDCLFSAPRRILKEAHLYSDKFVWANAPVTQDIVFPGYFHLFHASDAHLADPSPPWYDVTFSHAGGGDGFFQSRWPRTRKIRLPFEVLHLGPRDTNWFGRASNRLDGEVPPVTLDAMVEFRKADWRRIQTQRRDATKRSHSCVWLDPNYIEHVEVPGHEPRVWRYGKHE